jgi:outer membrane autotransporter protein
VAGTQFSSLWINNKNDPTLMALGGSRVYVTQDPLTDLNATTVDLNLVSLPPPTDTNINPDHVGVTAMAYGTRDNQNVLLAGVTDIKNYTNEGELWLSTTAAGAMQMLGAYAGQAPTGIAFDQLSQDRFYVADSVALWGTQDQGTTIDAIPLPQNFIRPTSVEYINNNGVDALLVGGLSQTANAQSPIAYADSNNGVLTDLIPFGSGLPNVQVSQMSYNPLADVLAVGTFGRGVWTLYDVTSYFPQAEVLQFGLADNDSKPDSSFLVDGTTFKRGFEKYGTGTAIIDGKASYTGGTTIFDGILQLGTGGESGSLLGDVSFCSNTIDPLNGLKTCNQGIDKFLVFDRSDTYKFDGAINGPGQLVQNGIGTTILTGDSAYTGPTWVNLGALIVNGSIVSPVAVNFSGLLGGGGGVGTTTVGYGGVLAPGNSIGTLTINGNLTLDPGALYEVEANARGQSDKVIVKGAVNLTGATLYVLAAGGAYNPKTDYVIIDNDGNDPVIGTFGQVANTLAFLIPSVIYDGGTGNDVVLTLERNSALFSDVANTRNQRAVAGALDRFPTDDPLFLTVLNQTEQGARQAFDALSGEIHATVAATLADDSRYVRDAVLGRLMQANSTGGSAQMAALAAAGPQVASDNASAMALGYDDKSLSAPPAPEPLAFWTRAYGAWANFNGDGNAATADRNLGGFVSGMDAQVSGSWRLGLATGASFSNVNVDSRYSAANTETYTLGGYLGGMASVFALRGGGMWAWSNIDTSRAVIFPGVFERQEASYDGATGQLFGEVAYPAQMWGMAFEPFAGLAYVSVDADNFHERGSALTSLRGRNTDENVGYTTVGLRAAQTMHWQSMVVTPHISAAWQHAFDYVTPGAALAFASTGIGFTVYGVPLAGDSALIDAGLDFALGERTTAGVSYSAQFGYGTTDNGVRGRFTWLFN